MENSKNNKRIFKNTLFLYFRMGITMFVSLYTVRVILKVLEIVDYGIYDVVGGIVTMLSFLSITMSSASQRYFAFELGLKNYHQLQKTISITIEIYFVIAFIVLIISETVGLWFLTTKMLIPPERMEAAIWVYQFSLFSFIITILTIPYNALIIAREKMSIYAYVSIIEVCLKLGIVFLLTLFAVDKLKLYAVLVFVVTLLTSGIYIIFCCYKYKETSFSFIWDKELFTSILSYSGWNLFGSVSAIASNQGMNIVLNLFFGPLINGSRAIAVRIDNAVSLFSTNIYTAFSPQIIKSYAEGDREYQNQLVFSSTKIAFFLLLCLIMPICIETKYVLNLWLNETTDYMVSFTRLSLIFTIICSLENPLTQVARSTGNIKSYQIRVGILTLLSLPIAYIGFKFGLTPESCYYVLIIVYFASIFVRLRVLKRLVEFPVRRYMIRVLIPLISITSLIAVILIFVNRSMNEGIMRFATVTMVNGMFILLFGWLIMTLQERTFIKTMLKIKKR